MSKKVSDFDPAPGGLTGTDILPIIRPGENYKTTLDDVKAFAGGGGGTTIEIAPTYAGITGTGKRLVLVTVDENNNSDSSLYIHDGTSLKFILTLP